MDFTRTILEIEGLGVVLYILILIGAAIGSLLALSAMGWFSIFTAGMTIVSGIVVLAIIIYMETNVWNST